MSESKQWIKDVTGHLKVIKKLKGEIGTRRDALRHELRELEDILESVSRGTESIACGVRDIEAGIDDISEML